MKAVESFLTLCLMCFMNNYVYCEDKCNQIRQLYSLDDHLKDSESSDPSICQLNSDNCCKGYESLLKSRASSDLKSLISSSLVPFNAVVDNSETQIKQLLHQILNQTLSRINGRSEDNRLKQANNRLFSYLLSVVLEGVSQRRVEQYVNQFFNALFVTEYEKEKHKTFSGEFMNCLSTLWTENNAFGDAPQTMFFQLQRAVESSSLLLRSLSLSLEVINVTKSYTPNELCLQGLVAASYCSHCLGHMDARPCRPFCLNVIRGCLSELSQLDIEWQRFINSWQHFSASLVGDRNLQTVLSSMDSLINKAINTFKSKTHENTKTVKVACGHPKRYLRNVMTNPNTPSTETTETTDSSVSFYVRIQTSAHQLSKTKEFYSSLSDVICKEYDENNCWNGNSIGLYTQPLVTFGAETQKLHSEVNSTVPQKVENSVISSLAEKLKKMSKIMDSYVTQRPSPSDGYLMDEDASGSGHEDSLIDDEDYVAETGSGSGEGEITESTTNRANTDIIFTENERNINEVNTNPDTSKHSSVGPIRPDLLLLIVVLLLAFVLKCH